MVLYQASGASDPHLEELSFLNAYRDLLIPAQHLHILLQVVSPSSAIRYYWYTLGAQCVHLCANVYVVISLHHHEHVHTRMLH